MRGTKKTRIEFNSIYVKFLEEEKLETGRQWLPRGGSRD